MGGKGWGVGTQLVETVRTIMVQQNLLHPLDGEKKEKSFWPWDSGFSTMSPSLHQGHDSYI